MAIKELFNDARPQVLFDPRASQRIDPRFKFTRDGVASYYDRDGVLRYAPANQPRVGFNYEPDENGVMLPVQGLLLEATGTNYQLYSEDLTIRTPNISYGAISGSTVLTDQVVAPNLTVSADLVRENTGSGGHGLSINHLGLKSGEISGQKRTLSLFAKAKEVTQVNIIGVFYGGTIFDLTSGTVLSSTGEHGIQKLANGWFRCWQVIPNNFAQYQVRLIDNGNVTYQGDGSSGLYVWGVQLDINSSYPTSYIPTSGSTVTREPDLLTIEAPLPSTGSIYIDARSLTSDVDTTLLSAAPASPSTDKLALAIRQPASLYNSKALVYEVDGAFKPTLPFPVPGVTRERNLITYGANNYHYRTDSSRYTPSSSTSVPANMTRLGIGHDVTDPTKAMTGYINAVYLWPGEITPTVAEALVRGDVDPKDADAGVFTPAAGSLAFVFNTQGIATDGNAVVQLPLRGSTNNVLVDWGDNTSSSLIGSAASVTVNHTYSSAGIYPVQIEADDDGTNSGLENLQFYANSPADLVRVLQWGGTTTFNPTTMYRIFRDCTQLDFATAARTNLPDTSAITDWREAFYNCSSISGTFPTFDTTAATTFASTWYACSSMTAFPFIESSSVTAFNNAWQNCSSLTSFPLINTSSGTNFYATWQNCSSLTSFPLINTAAGTNFSYAWIGCNSLTGFPLVDTSSGTDFTATWRDCSSLTSFPLIDTSSGTNFQQVWQSCSSLTSFPSINTAAGTNFQAAWSGCSGLTSFPLINTSSGTNFINAWNSCSGLTSFPLIDTSNGTGFNGAWYNCSSLTSFPLINTAAGTSFSQTWYNCSSLTSFPLINTAAGTNFSYAWYNCSSLTSFPLINTAAGTNFSRAWYNNDGLTAFPALNFDAATGLASDASNIYTGFREAWFSCGALADFPANRFDTTTCTRYLDAWTGCALTAQSIENILVSINTANTSNGNLGIGGGTNAAKTTWSTAANTAYDALIARGWTITYNA